MIGGVPIGSADIGGSGLIFEETTDLAEVVTEPIIAAQAIVIDFDSDALTATPDWTHLEEITGVRVSRWELRRGRSFEIDKTDTSSGTIYGTDTDGQLDPTNALSPYGAGIIPGRPCAIALRNPVTDEWSTLIRGHVAEFRYDLELSENVIHWEIDLVGPFDMVAATEMIPGVHGDTPPPASLGDVYFNEDASLDACQTRLHKILDDVGWPAGLREIFTGNIGLQGTVYARLDSALSALFDTADAEFPGVANVFERKDGAIVFHGRRARFDPTNPSYHITFWQCGDDAACAEDPTLARINEGLAFSKGKSHLINAATATPKGVSETDVPDNYLTDPLSIAAHGVRSESFTDLLTLNGDGPTTAVEETRKFADYYVSNFATPRTRINSIAFKSQHPDSVYGPAQWALLCGIDISDMLTVITTHPGGGGFGQDFYVEGVAYSCEPARPEFPDITLTVDLSPAGYYDTNPFD